MKYILILFLALNSIGCIDSSTKNIDILDIKPYHFSENLVSIKDIKPNKYVLYSPAFMYGYNTQSSMDHPTIHNCVIIKIINSYPDITIYKDLITKRLIKVDTYLFRRHVVLLPHELIQEINRHAMYNIFEPIYKTDTIFITKSIIISESR